MIENKNRNETKNQMINNNGLKSLKDSIKKVFENALLGKGESKKKLEEVLNDKEEFLKIFNPWHKGNKGGDLIEEFIKQIDKQDFTEDFSWLDVLNKDKRWKQFLENYPKWNKLEDKNKYLNMRYQIPTHFHGDIDNAVLFYCMENPRGYIKDSDMDTWAKKQMFGKQTIEDYYKHTAELRDETWKNEPIKRIIKERYNLNDFTKDSIEKIIYSNAGDETPLRRELENMFKENKEFFEKKYILVKNKRSKKPILSDKYYYISQFYRQLLEINGKNLSKYNIESEDKEEAKAERDKAIKISEKICNVEIYPFSSSQPKLDKEGVGETILLNSDLSRLGAYIILRRIYRYLNNPKKNPKPIIVLRKYNNVWEKLFTKIFNEVKEKDQSFDNKLVQSLLEKRFFYCQTGQQGGGITDGNVISVLNFGTVDRKNSKEFKKTKLNDFNSIKSLLTKVEI